MKKLFMLVVILFVVRAATFGQQKIEFDEIPFIRLSDSIFTLEPVELAFVPITESNFQKFKANQKEAIREVPGMEPDSAGMFTVKTKNSYFELRRTGEYESSYHYIGFIPAIQTHVIGHCGEGMCSEYLVDNESDVKTSVPSDYDAGAMGLLLSPSEKFMLVYSSYDGPDYVNYYEDRAEVFIFQIEKGKGLAGLRPFLNFVTKDWSIDDLAWVNDSTIALKTYEGQLSLAGLEGQFRYVQANIK